MSDYALTPRKNLGEVWGRHAGRYITKNEYCIIEALILCKFSFPSRFQDSARFWSGFLRLARTSRSRSNCRRSVLSRNAILSKYLNPQIIESMFGSTKAKWKELPYPSFFACSISCTKSLPSLCLNSSQFSFVLFSTESFFPLPVVRLATSASRELLGLETWSIDIFQVRANIATGKNRVHLPLRRSRTLCRGRSGKTATVCCCRAR